MPDNEVDLRIKKIKKTLYKGRQKEQKCHVEGVLGRVQNNFLRPLKLETYRNFYIDIYTHLSIHIYTSVVPVHIHAQRKWI